MLEGSGPLTELLPMPPRIAAASLTISLALCVGPAAADEWWIARTQPPAWAQLGESEPPPLAVAHPAQARLPVTRVDWREEWRLLEKRLRLLRTLPAETALRARANIQAEEVVLRASWLDPSLLRGEPDALVDLNPAIRGAQARSAEPAWAGLHVWAGGAGYAVGRRSAGYGIECGAALPLDEGVDLTAGYRMAGYALGERLDPDLSQVDERVATPFLGFDLRF